MARIFLAHSFNESDIALAEQLGKYLESCGFEVISGEKAENTAVGEKVRTRIDSSDIFIGLFTRTAQIVRTTSLLHRLSEVLLKKNALYVASSWIMQESGYAIGRMKRIVFLVEDGVTAIPGLQGDLEYISFLRCSFEKIFVKINQMLLSSGPTGSTSLKTAELASTGPSTEPTTAATSPALGPTGNELAFEKLDKAIGDKDTAAINRIYEEELARTLAPEEDIIWRAVILRVTHQLGDSESFKKLSAHVVANPSVPGVRLQFAYRLREMKEFESAATHFELALRESERDMSRYADTVVDAVLALADCLSKLGHFSEAEQKLKSYIHTGEIKHHRPKLLSALAELARDAKQELKFQLYAELALLEDPANRNLRFSLAYDYSRLEFHHLSTLHYERLVATHESTGGNNNLAVEYETLDLPFQATKFFKKSRDGKGTLAMANLAMRFIDKGFSDEATGLFTEAIQAAAAGAELHENIGIQKKRLADLLENESESLKKVQEGCSQQWEFLTHCARSFEYAPEHDLEKLSGHWLSSLGRIKITPNRFGELFTTEFSEVIEYESFNPLSGKTVLMQKNRDVSISGTVCSGVMSYKLKIKEEDLPKAISLGSRIKHESHGLVLFATDLKSAHMMAIDSENETTYIELTKTD